jgi:hypothetical protein
MRSIDRLRLLLRSSAFGLIPQSSTTSCFNNWLRIE